MCWRRMETFRENPANKSRMMKPLLKWILIGVASVVSFAAADETSKTKRAVSSEAVSLGDAHKGTLEIDLKMLNQFLVQPQEMQDFYTACRAALAGGKPDEEMAAISRKFKRLKLGGPMLGDITESSVAIWLYLPEPANVRASVIPEAGGPAKSFSANTTNRLLSVPCDGLMPDTAYTYEVMDSSKNLLGKGRFVTAPAKRSETSFRLAFGSDFHKIGLHRPELMRLIQERGNRALLLIGDLAVDDRGNDVALIKADYLLRDLSPFWQQLAANVPIYAAWDDHDYFGDDKSGAFSAGRKPIEVEKLRQIWKEQWNNPERTAARAGIYFQTRIGPVHYIALDSRSCRVNDQRGKLNSFLGETQMTWLKQQLRESTAPYILVSCGTMWQDHITAGKDTWGTWDTQGREELFQVIDQKKEAKVILLSGDRHGARGFVIPRPGNRKIYEFEAGTLGGVPGPEAYGPDRTDQLFGYPGKNTWAFGEFTFETVGGQPQVTFRLINETGAELESVIVGK